MTTEEFKQEVQKVRPQLICQTKRYLKDPEEIEDVVQDALLKLWLMRDELYVPLAGMASVVTRNIAIDHLRRHHYTESLEHVTVEDEVNADRRLERILAVVDMLPLMQQTVLRLRHVEGLSMSDIATITGSTEVAVRKMLSRARMAVRSKYFSINRND